MAAAHISSGGGESGGDELRVRTRNVRRLAVPRDMLADGAPALWIDGDRVVVAERVAAEAAKDALSVEVCRLDAPPDASRWQVCGRASWAEAERSRGVGAAM